MTKPLVERFKDAKGVLAKVDAAIARNTPNALPPTVARAFQELTSHTVEIDRWSALMEARAIAWSMLDRLETRADPEGNVPFGAGKAKFHCARLVGVQAYVAATWALADSMSVVVARILCTPSGARNRADPPQLISHFVKRDSTKNKTSAAWFESIPQTFGWPICISYAIRNQFLHAGGHANGHDFFTSNAPADGFQLSTDAWAHVLELAGAYGVETGFHRLGAAGLPTPTADLRQVLSTCDRELEDALGVILGSACMTLLSQVGFILGDDM
jgi:hypothetical protein